MEKRVLAEVRYHIRPGKRGEFCHKISEAGIAEASRKETGKMIDFTKPKNRQRDYQFGADELLVAAVPVYAGSGTQ